MIDSVFVSHELIIAQYFSGSFFLAHLCAVQKSVLLEKPEIIEEPICSQPPVLLATVLLWQAASHIRFIMLHTHLMA